MRYVVDTHAWVWYLEDAPELSQGAREALEDVRASLIVPTVVLAELKFLSERKRIRWGWEKIFAQMERDSRCAIVPLDVDVLRAAPASLAIFDALIVGTALALAKAGQRVSVVTADTRIAQSGLVPVVW